VASVRILHLEDVPEDAELVHERLRSEGIDCEVRVVSDEASFREALDAGGLDLILSDHALPGFDGIRALRMAVERRPEVPFVFVSGSIGEEFAIETLKGGATDYVLKERLARLAPAVRRAIREAEERASLKQAEEALRERDRRLRQILENLQDVFYLASERGEVLYVNPAYEAVWGRARADLYARQDDWIEAVHPEDRERVTSALASDPLRFEQVYRILRADGSVRWIRDRTFPVRSEAGTVQGIGGFAEDITQRRQAEQRIFRQAQLLDQARDAILTLDLAGTILYWNRGATRLYGWTDAEAVGANAFELLHVGEPSQVREAQRAVLAAGEWQGELQKRTKDGRQVSVESRWTLVRGASGSPESILVIGTDVSEQRALQAQFLRAQRMESIGTLAGGIAHDLNNILSPIVMAADILKRRVEDERGRRTVAAIETSARRGAEMIKQILTFARGVEGERMVLEPRQRLRELEKIVRETFPKSIELKLDVPGDLWSLSADPTQLHQVLLNLAVNARDAMPYGGELKLEARNLAIDESYARMHIDARPGPYVVLGVADTGAGMPPALQEKIFEPFFSTKGIGKGTGLGLSTSLAIVKSHGGFINVYSEVGRGTTFKVYLPALPAAVAEVAAAPVQARLGRGELILVVDDEAAIREIAREVLEASGYRVATAADGSEAVVLYTQRGGEVAAVVTDMRMPIMDGLATIRALRKIDPGVRIVATSGLGDDSGSGLPDQGCLFLGKPYTAEGLLAAVESALQAS
jgi:PAS domain S-box-containing protein